MAGRQRLPGRRRIGRLALLGLLSATLVGAEAAAQVRPANVVAMDTSSFPEKTAPVVADTPHDITPRVRLQENGRALEARLQPPAVSRHEVARLTTNRGGLLDAIGRLQAQGEARAVHDALAVSTGAARADAVFSVPVPGGSAAADPPAAPPPASQRQKQAAGLADEARQPPSTFDRDGSLAALLIVVLAVGAGFSALLVRRGTPRRRGLTSPLPAPGRPLVSLRRARAQWSDRRWEHPQVSGRSPPGVIGHGVQKDLQGRARVQLRPVPPRSQPARQSTVRRTIRRWARRLGRSGALDRPAASPRARTELELRSWPVGDGESDNRPGEKGAGVTPRPTRIAVRSAVDPDEQQEAPFESRTGGGAGKEVDLRQPEHADSGGRPDLKVVVNLDDAAKTGGGQSARS